MNILLERINKMLNGDKSKDIGYAENLLRNIENFDMCLAYARVSEINNSKFTKFDESILEKIGQSKFLEFCNILKYN